MFTIMYDKGTGMFYVGMGDTNVADYDGFSSEFKEEVQRVVDAENKFGRQKKDRVVVCKECGKFFFITPSEEEWYVRKNLVAPKRCESCRRMRKAYGHNL